MKLTARVISVLSVLIVGASVAWTESHGQDAVDISGYYGEKDGEFFVVAQNGEAYQVLWRQKAGDWIGVAIREGDNLAVGWHRSDGVNLGVSLYRIGRDANGPTLTGGWAAYPGGGIVKDAPVWSRKLATTVAGLSVTADAAVPDLAPGTYAAVTESEWSIELKLERDGGAIYTISNWEPGAASATTKSDTVTGRWSREGDLVTVSFADADAGKVVVYELIECLSYQSFGSEGCSFGLKPVTNTMSRAYSQPVWNSSAFKVPGSA